MKTHIFTQKFIWITFLFILYSNSILAQQISVTGTVIGTDDEPIIGVSILVKGTTQGVITDLNGNYTINTNSDATLVFSYVGCITQEVAIAGRKKINITLVEDSKALDEVVVIGYAVGNKRSVSGAVDRVTAKDMNLGYLLLLLMPSEAKFLVWLFLKTVGMLMLNDCPHSWNIFFIRR